MFTSHLATIALICGAVVLLMGLVWAARAPRAPGRRLLPRKRSDGLVVAVLVLDGVALMAVGALAGLGGDDEPRRDARAAGAPSADAAPAPAPEGEGRGGEVPSLVPVPVPQQADPRAPTRSRAFLVARLSGDGTPGQGNAEGRGGVWLDVRPSARHLCFDMAVDRGIAGSITRADVYRTATPGAPAHLTLVVPDDKTARRRRGCASRPPVEALRAVVDAPQRFHVTVFDEAHPEGAIRGTLEPCRSPCRTRGPDLLP